MGNFVPKVFRELPHSVAAECKVFFAGEEVRVFSAGSYFVHLKKVSKESMCGSLV